MPTVWCALKRSLDCSKSQLPSDVHDPKDNSNLSSSTRKPGKYCCPRSISDLRDVMKGREKPLGCSTRSLGSIEFLKPVTHEVVLDDSTWEIKISQFYASCKANDRGKHGPTFVGNLRPGTTDHRGRHLVPHYNSVRSTLIKTHGGGCSDIPSECRKSIETDYTGYSNLICQICGGQFRKLDAVEAHHLSKHAGEPQ